LGQVYTGIGDYRRAAEVLRGNVEPLAHGTPGLLRLWCIKSQAWLGQVLGLCGDFAEGRRYGEEALRLLFDVDDARGSDHEAGGFLAAMRPLGARYVASTRGLSPRSAWQIWIYRVIYTDSPSS
jgi:hypothetical protein